jgi:predicted enzyme related to lactoylglutathione lyase
MSRVTGIGGFFFRARDPETYPNGRFAWLADPEGNRIQLWEPNAAAIARDPGL